MMSNRSSNKNIGVTIPKEIRDYYGYEFVWVINKRKLLIEIKPSDIQSFETTIKLFKKKILKPILDDLEEAKGLTEDEKERLIEFRSKLVDF